MALVEQVSEQVAAPILLLTTTKVERAPAALASGSAQIGEAPFQCALRSRIAHIEVQSLLKRLPCIANPLFEWRLEAIYDASEVRWLSTKSDRYYAKFIPS